jgi:hypothetical protein
MTIQIHLFLGRILFDTSKILGQNNPHEKHNLSTGFDIKAIANPADSMKAPSQARLKSFQLDPKFGNGTGQHVWIQTESFLCYREWGVSDEKAKEEKFHRTQRNRGRAGLKAGSFQDQYDFAGAECQPEKPEKPGSKLAKRPGFAHIIRRASSEGLLHEGDGTVGEVAGPIQGHTAPGRTTERYEIEGRQNDNPRFGFVELRGAAINAKGPRERASGVALSLEKAFVVEGAIRFAVG